MMMEISRDPLGRDDPTQGAVISIGNFDGVHIGHQKVISHAVARAREIDVPSTIMTFNPHPVTLLRPSEAPPLLTTIEQRLELLRHTGVDSVAVVPFTHYVILNRSAQHVDIVTDFRPGGCGRSVHIDDKRMVIRDGYWTPE